MSDTVAGLVQLGVFVIALGVAYRFLGDYMARVYTSSRHLRVERGFYRLVRVDPDADQRWRTYAFSLLGFSLVGVLLLYALLRLQGFLPLSLGFPGMPPDGAFNTAVSFVTNTNWQWYAAESTLGHLAQMVGLAVQNFLSAAVGMAVAVALIRGFTRRGSDRIGNFWVDLTRSVVRILLPISFVVAVVLIAGGTIMNFMGHMTVTTLDGGKQTLVGGPVASQEVIKHLGTNGGGFFNANTAHPYESPQAWTAWLLALMMMLIPISLPRTFGRMVRDNRQGYAIVGVMGLLWLISVTVTTWAAVSAHGAVPRAAGAAMEGKEVRYGEWLTALFGAVATGTSTGAVNSSHDSFTALGGATMLFNMMLGEIAPGGVGSGLYGFLIFAVVTVFLAGLMVGRTPEYLGKKIGRSEITFAALYLLAMPAVLLVGAALAVSFPATQAAIQDAPPHGLTEVLYAFASASNNNGSSFMGLSVGGTYYTIATGLCMLVGRFVLIVLALRLAGSLARQEPVPAGMGTLPTHRPLFNGMLVGVVLIVAGLAFFPALALGPIAEITGQFGDPNWMYTTTGP